MKKSSVQIEMKHDDKSSTGKAAKVKPIDQGDLRVMQSINVFRNKDAVDPVKMNKQIEKNKRKDDNYLGDREIEQFESGYSDFGFGELVMSFPNPDFDSYPEQGITLKEAMAKYDSSLNVLNVQVSTQEREFQRKAFMISFLLLDDYVANTEEAQEQANLKNEENEKKRKEKKKKKEEEDKIKKLESKKKKDGYKLQSQEDKIAGNLIGSVDMKDSRQQLAPPPEPMHTSQIAQKNEAKKSKKGLEDSEINDLIAEIKYSEEIEAPILGNSSSGQSLSADQVAINQSTVNANKAPVKGLTQLSEAPMNSTTNAGNGLKDHSNFQEILHTDHSVKGNLPDDSEKIGLLGDTSMKGTERFDMSKHPIITLQNFSKSQYNTLLGDLVKGTSNNDLTSFMNVRKKLNKGKFMYKRKYDVDDFDWVITNHVPKDFQTLFRNATVAKLSNSKLFTRQHLKQGSEIVLSVKASDEVIKSTASYYKLYKQIELGYADILSLEPCDDKYRPLRLKYVLRLAVKNSKKKRETGLDETSMRQKNGVLPIRNLREYLAMDEDKFWACLGRKQLYFDNVLLDIGYEIKINMDSELIEIIDDNDPLTMKIWAAYCLYLDYMIYYCSKMKSLRKFAEEEAKLQQQAKKSQGVPQKAGTEAETKSHKETKQLNPYQKNAAFLYRLIFQQSIEDTNLYFKKVQGFFSKEQKLKNIWHYLNVARPIPPYNQFTNSSNPEFLLFWRTFETNEFKLRSLFTNMEKVKICDIIVNDSVNILKMLSQGLITNYFPIHEPHQLNGYQKLSFFQKLIEAEYIPEPSLSDTEEKVRKMFLMLDSQADSSDFDSESVIKELNIQWLFPWRLNTSSIRDYFGEKIAMYFQFLSSYTFHLSYMSVLGIIIEIILAATKSHHQETASGFRFFFGVAIIIWQVSFLEFWKQNQALFALTYGQENFQQQEQERPSFVGTYKRSIFNDKINQQYYPEFKRKMFIFMSLFMSLVIVCIVVGIIIALFILKAYMLEKDILLNAPLVNPGTLIGILNSIQIIFFNAVYMQMNDWMSEIENHQILESYENSYVSKVFMFTFCNTFNSCFFIAFFNDYIKIEKGDYTYLNFCKVNDAGNGESYEDCFGVLRTQMISIFIINVIKNIPELVVPLLKIFAKKTLRKSEDTLLMHPFRTIDTYINDQFDLEPYQTNREIDGTVSDYMELIIQFSFLCLFGLAFPVSFLLAFVNNVIEIQVDKLKIIHVSRRPIPVGASTIGTWFLILEIVSFISIFTNSGLIAFTSDTITSSSLVNEENVYGIQKRVFFVSFIVFLFLKYLTAFIIDDVPESVSIIKKRHKNCINSLLNGLSDTKAKSIVSGKPSVVIDSVYYPEPPNKDILLDQLDPLKIIEQEQKLKISLNASFKDKLMYQMSMTKSLLDEFNRKKAVAKAMKQTQKVKQE